MSDEATPEVTPIHVFDQTNGVMKDRDESGEKDRRKPRRGSEANTALGAHGVISGAQGGF